MTKTALAYTIATNTYHELVPMNKAREDHSSSAIGNSVWVFGGINGSGPLNSIERVKFGRENQTLTARKWETIEPHQDFSARANSAVCTISRHKMLILGGNVRHVLIVSGLHRVISTTSVSFPFVGISSGDSCSVHQIVHHAANSREDFAGFRRFKRQT